MFRRTCFRVWVREKKNKPVSLLNPYDIFKRTSMLLTWAIQFRFHKQNSMPPTRVLLTARKLKHTHSNPTESGWMHLFNIRLSDLCINLWLSYFGWMNCLNWCVSMKSSISDWCSFPDNLWLLVFVRNLIKYTYCANHGTWVTWVTRSTYLWRFRWPRIFSRLWWKGLLQCFSRFLKIECNYSISVSFIMIVWNFIGQRQSQITEISSLFNGDSDASIYNHTSQQFAALTLPHSVMWDSLSRFSARIRRNSKVNSWLYLAINNSTSNCDISNGESHHESLSRT